MGIVAKQGYQRILIIRLQKMKLSCLIAIFIVLLVAMLSSSASCEATGGDDAAAVSLKDWMAARCGPRGRSIWLYQGELIDLQSGRTIAAVEGVEVVQALSLLSAHEEAKATSRSQQVKLRRAFCRRLGDLQMAKTVRKMISTTTTTTNTDASSLSLSAKEYEKEGADDSNLSPFLSMGSLLSRKVFFYKPFPSSSSMSNSRNSNNKAKQEEDALVLRKIRLRPGSPERIIPLNQAAVCYETANTILERASAQAPPDGADHHYHDHSEWILHAEWPNGKTVWNRASVLRQGGIGIGSGSSSSSSVRRTSQSAVSNALYDAETVKAEESTSSKNRRQPFWKIGGRRRQESTLEKSRTLEFTVHHGQRPRAAVVLTAATSNDNDDDDEHVDETLLSALVMTQIKQSKSDKDDSDDTTTISPKRAAIVSFGPSSKGGGRGGSIARETYQYRMEDNGVDNNNNDVDSNASTSNSKATTKRVPSCTVRYTRYGEGPVWYGPNRMCTLELRGRRIDNLPSLISSSLSNDDDDNFDMVDSSSSSSSSSGKSKSIISSPPLLAQLAESLGFRNPSEDYYDVRDDDYGQDAVQSFRQSKASRATQTLLGITTSNGQEQDNVALLFGGGSPSNVRTSWFRRNRARLHGRIQTIAGRLGEATTVELIRKRSNDDMMEE